MHPQPDAGTRRPRRKSRYGCRNCKLRRVKCDETKPRCENCRIYGVLCTFDLTARNLQPLAERQAERNAPQTQKVALPITLTSKTIWVDDGYENFTLDVHDRLLFARFRHRTLVSIGGPPMVDIYESEMLQTAFHRPFLMHGMLAVAAIHDRYLGLNSSTSPSLRELHHWSRCTTLFNRSLSGPIHEEDRDPCWATASILGIVTFAAISTNPSKEPWPFNKAGSSNLDWIRLGGGKMRLWQMLNPLRPESAFHSMSETFVRMRQCLPEQGIQGVTPDLVDLCSLDELSTPDNNPYFNVAHGLSRLERDSSYGTALMVTSYMQGLFGSLLLARDPIALVLLYLWQYRARHIRWWFDMRANVELPAIHGYLKQCHAGVPGFLELMSPCSSFGGTKNSGAVHSVDSIVGRIDP